MELVNIYVLTRMEDVNVDVDFLFWHTDDFCAPLEIGSGAKLNKFIMTMVIVSITETIDPSAL